MRHYSGYRNSIRTLPDGNLGYIVGATAAFLPPPPAAPPPPPPPPPPIGATGASTGLYTTTGQAYVPPPVIQVPIKDYGSLPSVGGDVPGIGPADTMGPLDFPEWGSADFPEWGSADFIDPFLDPRFIGPKGGPPKALPGATAADIDAQQIDPLTGQPIESTAFAFGIKATPKTVTEKQKQNAGFTLAAIAAFLILGG